MDQRKPTPPSSAPRRSHRSSRSVARAAAVVLCVIPAVYLLATVIYALMNADAFASDLPRQLRYVIVPGVMAIALVAGAFRLPRNVALNVGVIVASVLATLFLFETWLTLRLVPRQANVVGVVDEGVSLETYRTNLPPAYTIKALNAKLGVSELNRAPLSALPDRPMMLCSMDGQPITYHTDTYGFHSPAFIGQTTVDIMVLGDSFAEGLCLPDGAGVIEQLRERTAATVVNTGSRGAGPLFELAVLGRYGPIFRPKTTLMMFFEGNDWENLQEEGKLEWLAKAMDRDADFGPPGWAPADLQAAGPIISRWWAEGAASMSELFRRRSMLRNYLALANTAQVLGLHYPKAMDPNPQYALLLRRAAEITQSWGGQLVLVYIPAHDRFGGLFPHAFVSDDLHGMMQDVVADVGTPMIDLTETFARYPDPLSLYAPDSHFSVTGAVLAAEEIGKRLSQMTGH